MYRLKIYIVGCDEEVLPHVRREVLNHWGTVEKEFDSAGDVVRDLWLADDDLCLFLVQIKSADDVAQIKRLAGTYVGRPIVALVNSGDGSSIVLKAMRAGAVQVVQLPIHAADFHEALDSVALQFGISSQRTKLIAVAGTSGGCGSTSVALNLAYEIGYQLGEPCLLMELSFRLGALTSHLDLEPRFTSMDLLTVDERLDAYAVRRALTQFSEHLLVLPAPGHALQEELPSLDNVIKLVNLARTMANYVVLDVPCTFDDMYFRALAAADHTLLVTEQKVTSIRGAQIVCNALGEVRSDVVVNRYDPKLQGFSAERLREILRVKSIHTIVNDVALTGSTNHGQPLRLYDASSRALGDIDDLVTALVPESRSKRVQNSDSGIFRRLSKVISLS